VTIGNNGARLISVVVCTYRRQSYLRRALASLVTQSLDKARYEVLVVDNACDDDVRLLASEYSTQAQVSYVPEPTLGLASARNTGARRASGEYIAFIDDDGMASPSWLSEIAAAFARHGPHVAAVGGPIDLVWEATRPGWLTDDLLPPLGHLDRGAAPRELGGTEWLFGGNMAFKASALKEAGGFSTGLGRIGKSLLSNEELLIQRELDGRGYARLYDPAVLVWHHVPAGRLTPEWFMRRFYWQGVSEALTFRLSDHAGLLRRVRNAGVDSAALVRSPAEIKALAGSILKRGQTKDLPVRCRALRHLGLIRGWLTQ